MREKGIKCSDCRYWSGQIGTHNEWSQEWRQPIKSKVLICAVRGCPQPDASELDRVDGRLANAEHSCIDYSVRI